MEYVFSTMVVLFLVIIVVFSLFCFAGLIADFIHEIRSVFFQNRQ